MTWLQRLLTAVLPRAWGAAIEAESRQWMLRCPCGHARSLWELGGMRWKSTKGPQRYLTRCPACRRRTWHTLAK